jgi:hypothetical protein
MCSVDQAACAKETTSLIGSGLDIGIDLFTGVAALLKDAIKAAEVIADETAKPYC